PLLPGGPQDHTPATVSRRTGSHLPQQLLVRADMPAAIVAALVAELRESPADHCRGDAQLLPPARPRGTRASDTRACDGRLQRRTLRHFPCAARTQHWQRAKVTSARENPLLWNLMWPIAGAPDVSLYF